MEKVAEVGDTLQDLVSKSKPRYTQKWLNRNHLSDGPVFAPFHTSYEIETTYTYDEPVKTANQYEGIQYLMHLGFILILKADFRRSQDLLDDYNLEMEFMLTELGHDFMLMHKL